MDGLNAMLELTGRWSGRNQVLLPGEPPHESSTTAAITPIVGGKFVQLGYTWAYDEVPQEGLLIVGQEPANDVITAVWIDSWHMGNAFMVCRGQAGVTGALDLRGTYAVESSADWGWRIVIVPSNAALLIRMYNVTPGGEEFLGVEARYTRTG